MNQNTFTWKEFAYGSLVIAGVVVGLAAVGVSSYYVTSKILSEFCK